MRYDFDKTVDRRGTDCLKYDFAVERGKPEGVLPLWVADMDFQTAPAIIEKIEKTAAHGIFGYTDTKDNYYRAVSGWYERHFQWRPEKEWLVKTPGIVFALAAAVRAYTKEGDGVLLQQPVYYPFSEVIRDNDRRIVNSPLKLKGGHYEIDFDDLEKKLADPQTTLMIFCNPHNPIGKIWDRKTLARIGALCARHHVTVISDEIHCDLCAPGKEYVPFASVNETNERICVTCVSASKAFNLAGLQSACIIAADPFLRHRVWRGLNTDEAAEPNVFACDAAIAALTQGEAWLDELRVYLQQNREAAESFLKRELPKMKAVPAEATYLLWLDLGAYDIDVEAFCAFLYEEEGLKVAYGGEYGEQGKDFLRINMAVPRSRLMEGLRRLKAGAQAYSK